MVIKSKKNILDMICNMLGETINKHILDRKPHEMRPLWYPRCVLFISGLLNNTVNTTCVFLNIIHRPVFIQNAQETGLALSSGPNWVESTWRQWQYPVYEMLCVVNKNRMMDNVQKHNNCMDIPSSQTFKSNNVNIYDYMLSNGMMISEQCTEMDVEGSSHGLIWGTMPAFATREWG
jgi:hypothetical protein